MAELKENNKHMTELKDQITDLRTVIKDLNDLIGGHPLDKKRGLMNRLQVIEDFVHNMENKKAYISGNIAAAVFIVTFLGGVIAFIIKTYITLFKK